ncbi:MAG TPA: TraB/GumN family protein [Stellaceae bacterium]|nr:TraB/GumN family protein [Stellaceae bacterium]
MVALLLVGGDAVAKPALWVVKGPKATIYLFGTIHILRQGQSWESPEIANAFAASRELWLEVPNADDTQAVQSLLRGLGLDQQHPLSTTLSPRDLAHLDNAAKNVGIAAGEKSLEPMRPWLASLALSDALLIHAGYDPASGVERVLQQEAAAANKTVRGFETLEQQMHFFADMPPQLQIDVLEDALSDADAGSSKLDGLVDAWLKGDQAGITHLIVDELKIPFPELYRTLLVARNEAWAAAIAGMLKEPGIRFIAVGAGHLAGPDSLRAKLAQRGIHVDAVGPGL